MCSGLLYAFALIFINCLVAGYSYNGSMTCTHLFSWGYNTIALWHVLL